MRGTVSLSRVVAGISLFCLGSLAFLGCSSSGNSLTSTTDSGSDPAIIPDPLLLITTIQGPTKPTAADIAAAVVKPKDIDEGAVTFHPLTFNMPGGRLLDLQGPNPAIDVNFIGINGKVDGAIPLFLDPAHKSICTKDLAILPEGDVTLSLSPDSFIAAYLPKDPANNSNYCVKVTKLQVKFSVLDLFDAASATLTPTDKKKIKLGWTLPVSFNMSINTADDGRSLVKGSKLILRWDESTGSFPPEDEYGNLTAFVHANFFLDDKKVLSTTEAAPILGDIDTVTFKGEQRIEFNRVEFTVDLRQGHTTDLDNVEILD